MGRGRREKRKKNGEMEAWKTMTGRSGGEKERGDDGEKRRKGKN